MNSPEPDLLGVLRDVSPQDAIWRRRSAEFGSEIASTINGYWERGESPADLLGPWENATYCERGPRFLVSKVSPV